MPAVEEVRHAGELRRLREGVLEILALGPTGEFAEEDDLLVARPSDPRRIRPGEMERLDEGVVLQEADEDAGEHPGDSDIGEFLLAPGFVGERGALAGARGVVGGLQRGVGGGLGIAAGAEVGVEAGDFALEVGEEAWGGDHSGESSLKGLNTFNPGRRKSRSLPVAMVRP